MNTLKFLNNKIKICQIDSKTNRIINILKTYEQICDLTINKLLTYINEKTIIDDYYYKIFKKGDKVLKSRLIFSN